MSRSFRTYIVTTWICVGLFGLVVFRGPTYADEIAAMKEHNRKVLEKHYQRPAAERDYRNTKEYKAQSPKQREETDKAIERSAKSYACWITRRGCTLAWNPNQASPVATGGKRRHPRAHENTGIGADEPEA